MDDWFCLCLCSHAGLWRSATEKSGCADAENYTMAVAGKTLFRIIDTDHLKVCFDVLETELHRIAVDTFVNVTPISYPDDLHYVRITAVSPLVEQTGMVRMEATLPPHPHFKPGMTVIVTLPQ